MGCECIIGGLLEKDEDVEDEEKGIPAHISARLQEDLDELYQVAAQGMPWYS